MENKEKVTYDGMNEQISNRIYDVVKLISLIIAPLGVFVTTMLSIWTQVDVTPITATVTAIEVFLGAILTISSNKYWSHKNGI